jgi:hypothetical protein
MMCLSMDFNHILCSAYKFKSWPNQNVMEMDADQDAAFSIREKPTLSRELITNSMRE